jgi:hypothetical protein
MTLEEFLELQAVRAASDELCRRTKSTIYPEYSETLAAPTMRLLERSHASLEDLSDQLQQDRQKFLDYAEASMNAHRNVDLEGEFPKGEGPGRHDRWTVVQDLGLSRDFLLIHLVHYWLLSNHPKRLEAFFRDTRMPNAKKEASRLRALFKRVVSHHQQDGT